MPSVKCSDDPRDDLLTLALLIVLFATGFVIAVLAPTVMYDLWAFAR